MTPVSGVGPGVEAVWEFTEELQPSRRQRGLVGRRRTLDKDEELQDKGEWP